MGPSGPIRFQTTPFPDWPEPPGSRKLPHRIQTGVVPIPPSAAEPLASTTQRILRWVERTPHAPAFIEPSARYGYGDLGVGIVQWARALASCGVGPGRLVGVRHDQRYLHFLLVQACQIIGATSVSLSAADIASNDPILGRCHLLCVPDTGAPAQAGVLALSQAVIDQVARSPLTRDVLRMLDHCPAETDIVRLVKTSGTTGRPKVLAMTQGAMNRLLAKTLRFPGDPGHAWNVLNLYDFTLRSALMETEIALRFGQTAVTTSMPTLLADMRRFSAFRLTMVSGDAIRLAAALPPDWQGPRAGLLSIKGGALPEATRTVLRERVVTHVYANYAANETHRIATIGEDGIGQVEPDMRVRIMGEDGAERPFGMVGEIEVSPALVDAYVWDEEASALAFRDGWYRTRDIGVMPEPGRLMVLGRGDEMVTIGGVKTAPQAMEARLRALPGIRDAVLLGVPLPDGIEELAVVLECDLDRLPSPLAQAMVGILAGVVERLHPVLLPSLPRTETGKVRRPALRAALAAAADAGQR